MIKDVLFIMLVTVWIISTIGLFVVIFFIDWTKRKSKEFLKRVTIALAIISAIFLGIIVALSVVDSVKLHKAVEETKTRETFLVENSVPLYLQEEINDEVISFRLYHYYDIEISEDGTYATLVPRNQKEK